MMDLFRNNDYEVSCSAENACLSVAGNHAWVGEGPSFFIPAAKVRLGRLFSVFGLIGRRLKKAFCARFFGARRGGALRRMMVSGCSCLVPRRL